jgi:branched-chain amino acid transport system substrate-binding protein
MTATRRHRFAVLAITTVLALFAAACGSSSKSDDGAGTTGTTSPPPTGTPLVIGWVGTQTSPTAGSSTLGPDGLDTWVKWTNAHGGIAGHPVQAYYVDDKADPAVGLTGVKDLVENKHVIALVGDAAGSTEQTWADYVLQHRIPVIHDQLIDALWFTNPMFYPLGGTVITNIWGQMKSAATQGATKVGILLCTEVAACAQAQQLFTTDAKAVGLDPVYNALASQTQASYTAECIAAKKAGAEAMAAFINTVVFSRDCGRQGFKPIYINSGGAPTAATIKTAPELGNSVGSSPDFPCQDTTIKAGEDFQTALKQYHPDWAPGGSKRDQFAEPLCSAWVGGQGFKKAIENAGVAATATATNEDVIKGLSMFKEETLDGLTVPVTLSDGTTPNPQNKCVFLYKWSGTDFSSVPSPGTPTCMP